ncbi:MAG: NnrS family protein [Gammaproteobacteria bacterium SHHR-1]|uniref:NnrS family protein n=1 Tax=Magnetovirga frankeli TaxID=947516 RepID=UPI00129381E6|nr:NnrS family protein [gamma proteobacterium SS-5]
MTVLHLQEAKPKQRLALWELGFRPFFLLASFYGALASGLWMLVYFLHLDWVPAGMTPNYWHAHEMVFGFGIAVVSGFLLTAIMNWTGIQTIQGRPLMLLTAAWIAARLAFLLHAPWWLSLLIELVFYAGLLAAACSPMYRVRQWRNLAIFGSKVLLLGAGNVLFLLGWAGLVADGMRMGLYTGVLILMSLVFTMGRRVIPFFIERGMGLDHRLRNAKWVDLTSLVGILGLWLAEMLAPASLWTAGFALLAGGVQLFRLAWWYAPGMWRHSLIWVLWAALAFVTLGLLLKALADWQGLAPFAAWHAITYGGIGLVTLGMMARASLGHSGRSVMEPLPILTPIFYALAIGGLIRVFGPILLPGLYGLMIGLSQTIWILSFATFFLAYVNIWLRPALGRF